MDDIEKLAERLKQFNCDPGPTSDPRECELPDDECECLIRSEAAATLHSEHEARVKAETRITELEMIVSAAQNKAERDQDRAYEASCRALAAERSLDGAVRLLREAYEDGWDRLKAERFLSTLPPAPPAPETTEN